MKVKVIKRIFGKGGKQLELGAIVERKNADGVFYEPVDVSDKSLETGDVQNAKELAKEIKSLEDLEKLGEYLQDERKTVSDAAAARLTELGHEVEGE